jgi:hypothetical protein
LWLWVVGGLIAWFLLGLPVALVVGRSIRRADLLDGTAAGATSATVFVGNMARETPPPVTARTRRRTVPLPAFGVALVVTALALETTGYVVQLTGSTGTTAQVLSMDRPLSLPRMFVAMLFAAAATAAVAGVGRMPGRRAWWLAVGAVAGGIAAVKAGSNVHSEALHLLNGAVGEVAAVLLSALAAVAVLGGLWILSRTERRDRRRVLGVLALYAGASVGLSAVSSLAGDLYGSVSTWAVGATFLEELGEALAGVAFLMAVLVGVAPRIALPARWALRRRADAYGLELHESPQGRTAGATITR